MSVKVLPYITDHKTALRAAADSESQAPLASRLKGADSLTDFHKILAEADRTVQAMAVDKLLSAAEDGGLQIETIQKVLGFNPAPGYQTQASLAAAQAQMQAATTSAETSATAPISEAVIPANAGSSSSTTGSLDAYFNEAAQKYGVDVKLLKAIAKAESNFNPKATSRTGAMGVMQLMPATAKSLGIANAYDAHDNILGGARVIAGHLKTYGGNLELALAAYNAGSGNVKKYGGIPPFAETQNYVKKVIGYYQS